jgi:hypothetical protein
MTRRVYDRTAPGKESSRAWQAFVAYRSMPAGERSLERLCEQFKEQAALHETNPKIPPPPTTNLDSLKTWSIRGAWGGPSLHGRRRSDNRGTSRSVPQLEQEGKSPSAASVGVQQT